MTVECHAYAPCTRHAHALCTCLRVHRRWLRRGVLLDGGAGVVGQRESESGAGDKVAPHPWRCRHGVRRSRRHVVIWDSHRTGRHDASHEASLFKGAPCGSHRRCVPWRGLPSGCVPLLSWSAGARPRAHQPSWRMVFVLAENRFFPASQEGRRPESKIVAAGKVPSREKARRIDRLLFCDGWEPSGHPAASIVFLGQEGTGQRKNMQIPTNHGGRRAVAGTAERRGGVFIINKK